MSEASVTGAEPATTVDRAAARAQLDLVRGKLNMIRALPGAKVQSHGGGRVGWDVSVDAVELLARLALEATRTLEVGAGVSTIVFAAAHTDHTAVAPSRTDFDRAVEYCARIGVDADGVSLQEGDIGEVVPRLTGDYDLALIDGETTFPQPMVDFHYASGRLRPGGVLVLDHVPSPAVGAVFRHLVADRGWELLEIVGDRTAAFRRLDVPDAGAVEEAPDYSFLPLARRVQLGLRTTATAAPVRAVRRRVPGLNRLASVVKNRLR